MISAVQNYNLNLSNKTSNIKKANAVPSFGLKFDINLNKQVEEIGITNKIIGDLKALVAKIFKNDMNTKNTQATFNIKEAIGLPSKKLRGTLVLLNERGKVSSDIDVKLIKNPHKDLYTFDAGALVSRIMTLNNAV